MILFIAPKKTGAVTKKKTSESAQASADEPVEKTVKTQPQMKAPKEYQGPKLEGED